LPRLTLFGAGSDVLLDDEQNPSLISAFCALDIGTANNAEIPENAVGPKQWMVLSMWLTESAEEIGKTFTHQLIIIAPNGKEFGNATEKITMDKRSHTVKMRVNGMPIGVEGRMIVKVWLESDGRKVTSVYEYPIDLRHLKHRPPI
jgi:hypothetical protein